MVSGHDVHQLKERMPATVTKNAKGGYSVRTPNAVHAKNTSLPKAKKQQRLLNAIDHGFKPDKQFSGR